jgi:excisionase family DNA binding protein
MPSVFKVTVVQHWVRNCWVGPDGLPCDKGAPGARFVKARKVPAGTPGAKKVKKKSGKWYGRLPGSTRPIPLASNKVAAQQILAEKVRQAERARAGLSDPNLEEHRERPLAGHLADFRAALEARDKAPRYVDLVVSRLEALLAGCGYVFIPDMEANPQRVTAWLTDLRRNGPIRQPLPSGQQEFTLGEVAALLGVKKFSVAPLVSRHGLPATGSGKARRFPRATVEALQDRQAGGLSVATANGYLTHLKAFCNWLAGGPRPRMASNPFAGFEPGNEATDRRHDRRELSAAELRRLLETTRASRRSFRGLDGEARFHLYALACATGFRAGGLASLTPECFELAGRVPTVTLPVRADKSRRGKEQPIPADVADLMRAYLVGKPAGCPLWPGTWAKFRVGALMLRRDLEAAGIPYEVPGPDGPLFADFHALRHSYLTLGGRAGIDLRTLQELAGHSTSKLTERYTHVRLHDLAGAVERLPSILPQDRPEGVALRATGTDGSAPPGGPVCTGFVQTSDSDSGLMIPAEAQQGERGGNETGPNSLSGQGIEASNGRVIPDETNGRHWIRTSDFHRVRKPLLHAIST